MADLKLTVLLSLALVWIRTDATPTCAPTTYTTSLGINTTAGTTLVTLSCTSGSGITYTIDSSSDGYSYFGISGNDVILANRLDVEYGRISWTVSITADDGVLPAASLTLTATTFRSTTTTTSTPPPPGYDWFDQTNNRYLFWSVMVFITLMTGTCIMLCFRFHRYGRCLPSYCPEYSKMIASFNRQFDCCPLPCNYYEEKEKQEEEEQEKEEEYIDDTPWGLPPRKPSFPTKIKNAVNDPKKSGETSSKKNKTSKDDKSSKKDNEEEDLDPGGTVSPLVIGNVNLDDVGFDGMRSPGFNAPMFTSYGGKKDKQTRSHVRRY